MSARAANAPYDALIGLGSNIGDKAENIRSAIALLTDGGVTEQDWFVNAGIAVATKLSPADLLARCQSVENTMKRVRKERWGPRTIDVDVLVYNGITQDDPTLMLPHPRITERAFVLVPLAEIAPDLVLNGHPLSHWLSLVDLSEVTLLDEAK